MCDLYLPWDIILIDFFCNSEIIFKLHPHNKILYLKCGTINIIVKILFMAPRMVYFSIINLLWSLMSKMSTTFRSVSYGPCSRTGVTCVASDFGGIIL